MDKKTEALKLALEAIEKLWNIVDDIDTYGDMAKADEKLYRSLVERRQRTRFEETGISTDGYTLNGGAITAIKEALAEQTALLAANKDLQNHFDALMNDYKKLSALCSSQGTRLMEYESSHEPESKPWVGLTRDERMSIINRLAGEDWVYAVDAIEAALKEKNT